MNKTKRKEDNSERKIKKTKEKGEKVTEIKKNYEKRKK